MLIAIYVAPGAYSAPLEFRELISFGSDLQYTWTTTASASGCKFYLILYYHSRL